MKRILGVGLAIALAAACGQEQRDDTAADSDLVDLTPAEMFVDHLDIAWDGEAFAVAFLGRRNLDPSLDSQLSFARVGADGELLRASTYLSSEIPLTATQFRLVVTKLAPDPEYAVFYRDNGSGGDPTYAFSFDHAGVSNGSPIEVYGDANTYDVAARVATDGSVDGYGLLASEYVDGGKDPLFFVTPDGEFVEVNDDGGDKQNARLEWNRAAQQFVAAWQQDDRVYTAAIGADGVVIGGVNLLFDEGLFQSPEVLALDETGSGIVGWREDDSWKFMGIDGNGIATWTNPRVFMPHNRGESMDVDVAAAGGLATIVWQGNYETPLPQIYAGDVDMATGSSLDDQRIVTPTDFSFAGPRAAASVDAPAIGVSFEGTMAGSERLFVVAED